MESPHAQKLPDLFKKLETSKDGLRSDVAAKRLEQYGPNALPEQERVSRYVIFFRQFHSFFIYILLLAALISFSFDHALDAYVIIAIIILNALIGYFQESRAEHAIEALKSLMVPKAKVLRDGSVDLTEADRLVPGDIVTLQSGDRVPADARIIHCRDLTTQESQLTGESFTVHK